MKYLVVPGTSVPSDRLFSKAGETISKTRNRFQGVKTTFFTICGQKSMEFLK